ncbi:hypothetical protein DIPPA_26071 [Diplonema papillatum]|nr:hypothetical protein DIPPA_26071 [Diplonema papillatum]
MRAVVVLALCAAPGVTGSCASLGGHWYDSASDDVMSVMESGCVLESKYGQVSVSGRNVMPVKGLWKALGVTGELDGMQSTIAWSNGVKWSKTTGGTNADISALLSRIDALEAKTAMLEQELAGVAACAGCSLSVPVPPGSPMGNVSSDAIVELQRQVQNLTEVVSKGGRDGKNGYCTMQPNVTSVYIPVTRYVYRKWGDSANKCTLGGPANRGASASATNPTMMSVGTVDGNCIWSTYMSEEPIYAYKGDTLVFWRNGARGYSLSQFETEQAFNDCDFSRSKLLAGLIDFEALEKAGKNYTMTLNVPGNYYFGSLKSGVVGDASKDYCNINAKVLVIVLDPVREVLAECPLYDPSLYGVVGGSGDAADSATVQKLKGAVAAMGRQLVAVEQRTAQRVREQGQSGVTLVRSWNQGTDAFYSTTYAQSGAANMHNHADTHHTIGLGEFGAVLNGVQFTTRHNDYSLLEPDDSLTVDEYTSKWPPKAKTIEQPPVPPSVLNAGSVQAQLQEMREYFRAFHTQNLTHRDYRPYFQSVMCYLEGTWTGESSSVAEPFASERHHIDAESWTELTQKTNFLFNNGQKNNDENLPFLPTSFRGMKEEGEDTFEPIMAQWFYRISCKKLEEHLPTTSLRVRNDVHLQMAEYHPATRETLSETARAVYEIHPSAKGGTWPKGKTTWEFLDDLMYNISGFDGPNAHLVDNSFGDTCGTYRDGSVLNTARYSRYYSLLAKDAMGKSTKKRSFNDMLFAAQTTHDKVSAQNVCAKLKELEETVDKERTTLCEGFSSDEDACRGQTPWRKDEVTAGSSGAKCVWATNKCQYHKCWEQRWSYAIPLEIIYLTPLAEWNPYNIPYITDSSSPDYAEVRTGRDGSIDKPYKYSRQDTFYRTPAALFKDLTDVDDADTSGGATYVLDQSGTKQTVRASGHWIMFPEMDGMHIRQRYPVFPIHEEGSTIWKEVKAVEELIMGKDSDYIKAIIAETRGENYGLMLELTVGSGHTHELSISPAELASLKSGATTSLYKVSTLANGHQHYVKLDYDNSAKTGEEWSLDWCTQSADRRTCRVTTGCSAATDDPYCCVDKCPDLHPGVKVA